MKIADAKFQDVVIETLDLISSRTVNHSDMFGMKEGMCPLLDSVSNTEELWELGDTKCILKFLEMVGFELNNPMLLGQIALQYKKLEPIQRAENSLLDYLYEDVIGED